MPEKVKHVMIVGDGMADYPVESLGGKTPLMAAETPHMDLMANQGEIGLARTISGLPSRYFLMISINASA